MLARSRIAAGIKRCHPREGGDPRHLCAKFAFAIYSHVLWIPVYAGMTTPRVVLGVRTLVRAHGNKQ